MYFKRVATDGGYQYFLRETYRENGTWTYRNLLNLGPNPARFIGFLAPNIFYLTRDLKEALEAARVEYSMEELEDVFVPFLPPRIRWVVERLRSSYFPYKMSRACSREELPDFQQELHAFDVRRLHFLKFGHMNMAGVERSRSWRFLSVLSCKCRDEIEATFDVMEQELDGREINNYIYTALYLQKYFAHHPLQNFPLGLDLDQLDDSFQEEICRLNQDDSFFRGVDRSDTRSLHPYLAKYAALYFDHEFEVNDPWEDFFIEFFQQQRFYRPAPPPQPSFSIQEAYLVLEISHERFEQMSRQELIRLYRRKAKKMHPDKGGDHDAFVRLGKAYEVLLALKR